MQRKKYENPLIVEELVFQIAPELLDRYLEGDFTCFTTPSPNSIYPQKLPSPWIAAS